MDSQTRLLRGSEVIDLKKILQLLGRRRALLFGVVSIVSISAAITVFYLPPLYTAETTILIESEHKNIVKIDSVIAPYLQDRTVVENQTLILQSRTFIRKIVKTLKLDEDPAFNSELDSSQSGETFWKKIDPRQVLPKRFLNAFSPPANLTKLTQNEKEDLLMKSLVTKVLKNLEIEPIRKTRGIQISYTSKYPRKAALIVNTIAEQYIVEQLDAKFEATRKATKWLSERISVLKKKVEESEKAVEMYKKESGLGSASGLPSQQVAEFSRQLMEVRSQRREAEASLGQMNLMADSPEGVGSMGKVLSSPLIQGLRVREVDLLRKISEFKTEYGERHPKMINLRTEIKDLRKKIKKEIDKIAFGIKNEVQVIIESEKSLEKDLDALKLEASEISRAEIRLRALEREAEADRVLFETFLKRFKETSTQDSIQQPDARVISRADIPSKPSFPNKKKTIGIAFAVSIFCGLFLISVLEFMDSGFRSTEQIETLTGISALGYIPQVDRKSPEDFILQKPYSAYGESIRSLRTSLLLSNVDTPPKVILVTSGIPEEGKTTTALSLARLAAMSGQKTFALECDLRRPTFAKRLMEKDLMAKISKKGLVELLAQEVPFSDVVHSDKSGIDFICAGRSVASPTDLFSSKQMTELVSKLSREYDLIVFDTPPVLAVSDARILGALADKTIFVTRWETTRREIALGGLKLLIEGGANLSGVVLSQVNITKHAKYGYYDTGYYYGKYKQRYSS